VGQPVPDYPRRMLGNGVRAGVCAVLLLAAACGSNDAEPSSAKPDASASASASGSASGSPSARPVSKDLAVDKPGELTQPLLSSDVLVYSQQPLEKETVERIKAIKGVTTVEPISMGSFFADEREVTYAAVDPSSFRRFTPPGTAQTAAVWERVAGGEIAIEPKLGRTLQQKDGYLALGNGDDAEEVHIGAYAQILDPSYARRIDAVVNDRWVDKLGMRRDNAMIVSLGSTSPQSIRKQLQRYAGSKASVQILGPDLDINATQTALLTGGSVASAVGSFSYTANPDGTVDPDPGWVRANIRTEVMPIIGRVTGHRVMLPQLRAALNEVVSRGLSSKIYTYDGLYVPRFIARDPSRGLSFHTYGTAIDLNARDNYRGIAGKMDRQVVTIFKKWGFAWGGDWNYTDPMHFELAKLVKVG
jgi:hypothetical protein